MVQLFLHANGRAVANEVMQHHTLLQVIYAHQPPASCQGATLSNSCVQNLVLFHK